MRLALYMLAWMVLYLPACAKEFAVEIRAERAFGYFVGDLVRSLIEIRGPADAELARASLPHPASLRVSLIFAMSPSKSSRMAKRGCGVCGLPIRTSIRRWM